MAGPFYGNLESIMNMARSFANDSYNSGAGEVLTDNNPATIGYINSSYAELQDRLENIASPTVIKDNYIVTALDPIASINPTIQTSLSWIGYTGYNGTAVDSSLTLPSDMMAPEKLWERQSGTNTPFVEMMQPQEGLPSVNQSQWLRYWEWRTDSINFVGSTVAVDIRIRYTCRLPFAKPNDVVPFSAVTINILGCERAMAYLIAYRYAAARSGMDPASGAQALRQEAELAILELKKRIVRQKQGIEYRRKPYSDGNDSYGVRLPW
jgi:hypothetical protein